MEEKIKTVFANFLVSELWEKSGELFLSEDDAKRYQGDDQAEITYHQKEEEEHGADNIS